jgi:hypothetical protein
MGLRSWLRKLERGAREGLVSFELLSGSRYFYDASSAAPEMYLFFFETIGTNPASEAWPEPPEVLQKLCEAKDVRVAFEAVMGGSMDSFTYDDIFPYSPEVLVNERRLEPRSLVAGRDPYDGELDDLSE